MSTHVEQRAAKEAADRIHSHSYGAPIGDLRFELEQITDYITLLEFQRARLRTLIAPILARTKGQIGTHSDRCYEYHVGCLAAAVEGLLEGESERR